MKDMYRILTLNKISPAGLDLLDPRQYRWGEEEPAPDGVLVRSAAMTSRIAMMHVVDILYSAVAAQGYDRYKPFLDKTHLAGREKRRSQHERRR